MKKVTALLALALSCVFAMGQSVGTGGVPGANSGGGAPSGPAGGALGGTYPNPTVVGAITPTSVDAATFYAGQYSGSDMGAKVNTAAAACSGGNSCVVKVPAGFYAYATAIVLPQSVTLEGEGPEASWLDYSGTGTAIAESGAWAQVKNIVLQCSAACAYGINMTGGSNVADNLLVEGGTSATTMFGIHGPNNRISNIVGTNLTGTLYECDNAVNNFINNSQSFGASANTTAVVVDMNSGCDNLQIMGLQHSYSGLHGFIMRNTLTGGAPTGAFFSNFVTDQSAGGSMWVFDSTLGAAADNFVHIVNGFAGSAGQTGTTITTAAAIGIDIEGGRNLSFDNVNVIDAAATGVLINNSQVTNVKITHSFINNNNRNNTASTNGVTISAAASGIQLVGNTVGNLTGDNSGNQTYGIGVTSSGATNLVISGNDLNNNVTGALSNSSTGSNTISGNLPTSANPLIPANYLASPVAVTSTCTVSTPGLYQNQTSSTMSCTLPTVTSATTMSLYCFAQGNGNTGAITVTAPASTTLLIQGVNTAAAGNVASTGTAADAICLQAFSTTQYVATLGPGVWNGITQGIGGGAVGSLPYQSAANVTGFIASPTTSGNVFVPSWQPSGSAIAPSALNLNTWDAAHAGLTLNYVANVAAPTGTPSGSGGTVAASTTNFAYISCLDAGGVNQTLTANKSANVTTSGTTSSIAWAWTAVTGCSTYRVWVATTGTPSFYFTSATNSFTQIAPASSGTSGTFPTVNTTGQLNLGGASGVTGLLNLTSASSNGCAQGIGFGTGTSECIYGSNSGVIAVNASTWFVNGNVQASGGFLKGNTYTTNGNCSSAASPASCVNDAAGSVVIAAGATSVVVDTNEVDASSQILLTEDQGLGTKLTVTCDTTSQLTTGAPRVSARTPGTSFTIVIDAATATNPMCVSFLIVN